MNATNSFGLDTTETIFCFAIAILYPCFFYKLTDKLTGYSDVQSMCDKYIHIHKNSIDRISKVDDTPNEQHDTYDNCKKERNDKIEKVELYDHIMLIVIALIGIILSSVIQTKSTKLGVGLGGVFTLLITLSLYWYKYKETTKLMIYGASLFIVTYLSIRLYRIDNISDIFAFEFGTK